MKTAYFTMIIIVLVVVISGCPQQQTYICPNGQYVTDPAYCNGSGTQDQQNQYPGQQPSGFSMSCGNGVCDSGECSSCASDCSLADCSNNGLCDLSVGENCQNSPNDCICSQGQICDLTKGGRDAKGCYSSTCGDGVCDSAESSQLCCTDCGCPSGYECNEFNNTCEKQQADLTIDTTTALSMSSTALFSLSKEMLSALETPLITVNLYNTGSIDAKNIEVKVTLGSYADPYTESIGKLTPSTQNIVKITPRANSSILQITSNVEVPVQIEVKFEDEFGEKYTKNLTESVQIKGRNDFIWYPPEYVVAWITPREENTRAFATEATPGSATYASDAAKLEAAEKIFDQLDVYGVRYNTDALGGADYLQFPVETLYYRNGDCDDLAILYSSLLESIGIPTKLVLVPRHIFVVIELEETIAPVEQTMIGRATFHEARLSGNTSYNNHIEAKDITAIISPQDEHNRGIRTAEFNFGKDVPIPKITATIQSYELGWNITQGHYEDVVVKFTNEGGGTGGRCVFVRVNYEGSIYSSEKTCLTVSGGQTNEKTIRFNISCGLFCSYTPEPEIILIS